MTTERLRAELLLILSPVRERRIWRCLSRDDNERKAGLLFLARERSFAQNRTKPGWRSSDRHPASAFVETPMTLMSQIGRRSFSWKNPLLREFGQKTRAFPHICNPRCTI